MKKPITLHGVEDIEAYMEELRSSAGEAHLNLAQIVGYTTPCGLGDVHGKN
jgi:hypothetical protein